LFLGLLLGVGGMVLLSLGRMGSFGSVAPPQAPVRLRTALDAFERGDLDTAIAAVAKMAKIQHYGVTYIAPRLSASQKFIIQLANDPKVRSIGAHLFTGGAGYTDSALASFSPLFNSLEHTLTMQDKSGLYAYCFCDALNELH